MKVLSKLWNLVSGVIVAAIVILAILLGGVRLVGLQPFAVLSGSMEPTYHVGSLIYVKACDPADIQVGDPITFVLDEKLTVATHRVIEIDPDGEHFYTKGDANNAPDGTPVYGPNIIGRPVFTVPYLGYFSDWITNPPGMYVGLAAGAILVILMFLPDLLKAADAADKRDAEKKKQKEAQKEEQIH